MPKLRTTAVATALLFVTVACSGAESDATAPSVNTAPEAVASATPSTSNTSSTITPTTMTEPVELPSFTYGPDHTDLGWLANHAALAVLAELPVDAQLIDLAGKPILADRVAIGLEQLDVPFTRSTTTDIAGHLGTNIIIHRSPGETLREWTARQSNAHPAAIAVHQETVAALNGADLDHATSSVPLSADSWLVAESAPPQELAIDIVDAPRNIVAWSNREAQSYVAENVDITAEAVTISTRSRTSPPSIDELPYESGMAISVDGFGWSTITADVMLPSDEGLWPAIWLLSTDACEGAGRCSGFESTDYHEIDLLETAGGDPTTIHTTVHWWNERHDSSTATRTLGSTSDSTNHRIELERRPGLLIWRIDGEVVHVVADQVDSFDSGPHRSGDMMLLINTAVGGTFAGPSEIGQDGEWLGEALVPASYPDLLEAEFNVTNLQINRH